MAESNEKKTVRVRQIRSGIGCTSDMRETLRSLGIRRMNQTVECPDSRETRGKIKKIQHLLEVID